MREISLFEVGMLKQGESHPDLRKGKLVFLPIYFLIHFKGLIGVKKDLVKIRTVIQHLGFGIKEREEGEGIKIKIFDKNAKGFLVEFVGGDPFQGM